MKARNLLLAGLFGTVSAGLLFAQKQDWKENKLGEELAAAPEKAGSWKNPYEGNPDANASAFKNGWFRHGVDGFGTEDGPNLHQRFVREAAPGQVFWFLRNGDLRGGMPSWSRLPDQQRWQLVSYLKKVVLAESPAGERPRQ